MFPALLPLNLGHGKITQPLLLWWLSSHRFFRIYCDQLVCFSLEVKNNCSFWSLFWPGLRSIHKYADDLLKSGKSSVWSVEWHVTIQCLFGDGCHRRTKSHFQCSVEVTIYGFQRLYFDFSLQRSFLQTLLKFLLKSK